MKLSSLDGTDFASCKGRESEALVEFLCAETDDLKMGCPYVIMESEFQVEFPRTQMLVNESVCH